MSYALPSDMLARYDARRLGDLCQDAGTRVTAAALLSDPNLQAALDDSSSLINAACFRGGRYLPTDLTGLTGVDKALLLRLNCDLAYGFLVSRRGLSAADTAAMAPNFGPAQALLQSLAGGELIFNVPLAIAAGKLVVQQIGTSVGYISSISRIYGIPPFPGNPNNIPQNGDSAFGFDGGGWWW